MSEFVGVGKQAGLELWRIEDLKPVKIPKVDGKFFQGDSYILLSTTLSKSGKPQYNTHFWLGSESSQDEQGVAAYKAHELDDLLKSSGAQFREVEGNESPLFLSYFTTGAGLQYLPGGVASGFKHVERDVYETRLVMLKGKRTPRSKQVPLEKASLTKGDVFILDAGLKIYQFNGPTANKYEKAGAANVLTAIKEERGGRPELIFVDSDPRCEGFWGPLGGYVDPNSLPDVPDAVAPPKAAPKLFRVSDASGSVQFSEVSMPEGKLTKDLLDSGDVFVVHTSLTLYVWVGKGSSPAEKKEATSHAVAYSKKNGLDATVQIQRVAEGLEPHGFKSEFVMWTPPMSFGFNMASKPSTAAPEADIDVASLIAMKQAEETPVDDGSGKLEVWSVQLGGIMTPIDPTRYGQFYGGDSYVLKYTYMQGRKECYIVYFWLGARSSTDEKGTAALKAKDLDDEVGGAAVQVRVVQGKEPAHFRQLFKGKMIVHAGGKASGFKNSTEADSYDTDGVALFHVKGSSPLNTSATQVEEKAASMNSEDCFVLINPTKAFAWKGNACSPDELAVATNIAGILAGDYNGTGGREMVSVTEGSEPEGFWDTLGGKGEYASASPGESLPKEPRLFRCTDSLGTFQVEECVSFTQSDLLDEDVFLLDLFTSIFVWIGSGSTENEKKRGVEMAQKFITDANDGRDADMPVTRVFAGSEPVMFTTQFAGWDADFAEANKFTDPYQARLMKIEAEKNQRLYGSTSGPPAPAPAPAPAPVSYSASGTFSYEDLKSGSPDGVDPAKKESYLEPSVFQSVFGMTKEAFEGLPKWKKDAAKKKVGLW